MSAALIQVHDLTRLDAKGTQRILDRVNLSIREGDQIGLVGPTGSGKSSLLRAIAMLDHSDLGNIVFQGQSIRRDAVPAYRRRVIYLQQRPEFVAGSLLHNLELPFRLGVSADHLDRAQVTQWLDRLSFSRGMLEQDVDSLSGGQRQVAALVRAMTLSPQVLLLDEPTAELDPPSTRRFERLVMEWQNERAGTSLSQRAFLWTSHNSDLIGRMATRVLTIDKGSLQSEPSDV